MILSASNINFSYKNQKILNSVTISVPEKSFICLTGPNGAGKSTLLHYLFKNGTIDGKHFSSPKERAKTIAFMGQSESSIWDYSVRDFVLMGRYCHTNNSGIYSQNDYMVTDSVLKQVQISNLADKSINSISGGEFQKVRIARCLAQEPKFLLLDEPVASLDFSYQEEIIAILKNLCETENTGILISIHDINLAARFADTLALLPKLSPLIMGTVEEIFTPENLKKTYGSDFKIFNHPVYNCLQTCI